MVSKKKKYTGMEGRMGGLAVKGMIKDIEEKMADGLHVSAAPSSSYEKKELEKVKIENKKSAENAK